MVTGIKIYNDAGTVQIDETYANFVLIDKQTYTISTPTSTSFDYSVSGDVVVVAVKVYPETFTTTAVQLSGGVWTYRLTFYNNPDTTGTCTFTVYAFGKPPTPSENIGLKVQDAAGNLVFHSEFKPLRIVGVSDSRSGFVGPAGRTVAALVQTMAMYSALVGASVVTDTYSMRTTGNAVQTFLTGLGNFGLVGFARDGLYAAVDVTNY